VATCDAWCGYVCCFVTSGCVTCAHSGCGYYGCGILVVLWSYISSDIDTAACVKACDTLSYFTVDSVTVDCAGAFVCC